MNGLFLFRQGWISDHEAAQCGQGRSFFVKLHWILIILSMLCISCSKYLDTAVESPSVDDGTAIFRFRASSATRVQVAGDWNNWGRGDAGTAEVLAGLMIKNGKDGIWTLRVRLEPGRYRYRFLIDERFQVLDPSNPRIVNDAWGGKANLLIMP